CAQLLQNVERIVALGGDRSEVQEAYAQGDVDKAEQLAMEGKRQQAKNVAAWLQNVGKSIGAGSFDMGSDVSSGHGVGVATVQGWLWQKRWHPRARPRRHQWIKRYCSIEDRVLYCRVSKGGKLKRAVILNTCQIIPPSMAAAGYKDGKYPQYFEVRSASCNMRLRGCDEEEGSVRDLRVH
ncbi:unnamed protein product, partial [Chrysoparadoxa australica]